MLQPISPNSYVMTLRDTNGIAKLKVEVSTEQKDNIIVPSLLSLSGNGAHNISEWISDWRKGWYGKRAKGMGSKQLCTSNMITFFKRNPKALVEDVYAARDMYIKSVFERNGHYTYLQQADHFIIKQKIDGTVERNLESFYEEVLINKEIGGDVHHNQSHSNYDNV
jgi:hypothetical protein